MVCCQALEWWEALINAELGYALPSSQVSSLRNFGFWLAIITSLSDFAFHLEWSRLTDFAHHRNEARMSIARLGVSRYSRLMTNETELNSVDLVLRSCDTITRS